MCLAAVADAAPDHSMAPGVSELLPLLESILREIGKEPAQLLLWETAADLIERKKLGRARMIVEKLVEGWPEDQKAAELLAALPSVA